MPTKKRRRRKTEEEHSFLTIHVDHHGVRADASINHDVYAPQYAAHTSDADPLYCFETQITISGTVTYPETRVGDVYEVTICGDKSLSGKLQATTKDVQARDEHGTPKYREYRGRQIPVYEPPLGLGLIDKVRGTSTWTAWLTVAPQLINDMLVVLGCGRETFLEIHERKRKRVRWIQGLSLQTTDPSEDPLANQIDPISDAGSRCTQPDKWTGDRLRRDSPSTFRRIPVMCRLEHSATRHRNGSSIGACAIYLASVARPYAGPREVSG